MTSIKSKRVIVISSPKVKNKAYLGYPCSRPDYYSHNNQNHHLVVEVESSSKTTIKNQKQKKQKKQKTKYKNHN
jgi:hypothetical protein